MQPLRNYIAGSWQESSAKEWQDVLDPASGEVLAKVPLSSSADVDLAVRAARDALPAWRETSVIRRGQIMFSLQQKLLARKEELARSVTREMGKTLADAEAEVGRMIEMVEAAAAVPTTMQGRILENVSRGVDAETIRQPVGVCAAIAPFNFPAMVPFWFLPFSIACGNTFILKPSEQVPLTQQLAFEILDELQLPPGVVNLVHGSKEVVEGLIDHEGIAAISFVGSAPVAKIVYERAASHGKRVQALGGAKNHMVVCPDAVVDPTVRGLIGSAFGAAGQRCMAGSVLITVADAYKKIVPELLKQTSALQLGSGLEESTDIGPVISAEACRRIENSIQRAEEEGARVLLDGRDRTGNFVGPTIIDQASPSMSVVSEEIFGPVLTIIEASDLEEALDIIAHSPFGNGASIFTESAPAVRKFRSEAQAGMIGVNIGVAAPVAFFPFSGWKASFLGDLHAHGLDAIEFFTRKKTITSRFFSDGRSSGYFVE